MHDFYTYNIREIIENDDTQKLKELVVLFIDDNQSYKNTIDKICDLLEPYRQFV